MKTSYTPPGARFRFVAEPHVPAQEAPARGANLFGHCRGQGTCSSLITIELLIKKALKSFRD